MPSQSPVELLETHVAAFNDGDVECLLAGFAEDAEWVTGRYRCSGHVELTELFVGAFAAIAPQLETVRAVAGSRVIAAELVEDMTVDGRSVRAPIAGFYTVQEGRITSAKIYREGSADIPRTE